MNADARNARALWPERLIQEIAAADQRARELTDGLTPEQLNWQPASDSWSIGQCLEHLCVTNEYYVAAISPALDREPNGPVPKIELGWFARWFMRSFVEPSPQTKRAKAPKKIVPASRVEASVLDRFLASNSKACETIRRAAAYDVNRIRFKNPFFGFLRFTVGTGLQLMCSHNRRHLLQAERVKLSPDFLGFQH